VTSVDHRSGKLTLQTVDGPFTVTFPPAAVQGVEQGEQVTVAIGLRRQGAPLGVAAHGFGTGHGFGIVEVLAGSEATRRRHALVSARRDPAPPGQVLDTRAHAQRALAHLHVCPP
jgi:hypothetical protein